MHFQSATYPSCASSSVHAPYDGMLAAIWLWFRLLSLDVLSGVLGGDCGRRSDADGAAYKWPLFSKSRARSRLIHHHPNSPLPPARNLAPFYAFGPRVSPTQFLERRCRLSVDGRIGVYRMAYWSSRLAREALMAIFSRGDFRAPDGLWAAHIPPD
ncbi:hypothetical protein [Fretibacter rubidus]|uniref:hypothetical protein n=1 Tax=Fretibacter rubidus TaxID=570162 RepID=UPI00352A7FCE